MKANPRNFVVRLSLAALAALAVVAAGCTNDSSMDNKYDESKLPPKPTDGRGPSIGGGAMSPGGPAGGAPAAAGAKANTPAN